jgi:hypothetical protein
MLKVLFCSKCGKEKVNGYCQPCKSEQRLKRIAEKRLAQGLSPVVSGREPHCDTCLARVALNEVIRGEVCAECQKIARRKRMMARRIEQGIPVKSDFCLKCGKVKTNGRCLPCNNKVKNANKSAKRAKLREEQGKRPWGSGRPETCYKCGGIKENKEASYCNNCNREDSKRRWKEVYAPKENKRPITLICECGREKESSRKIFCNTCLIVRKKKRGLIASRELRARPDYIAHTRSIYCSSCKEVKENRNSGYCHSCEKERYGLRNNPDCVLCGSNKENIRDSYCNECKRNKSRVISESKGKLPHNMEAIIKKTTCLSCFENGKNEHCIDCAILLNEERKFRAAVRRFTRSNIKYGVLKRKPCEVCGAEEVEAHHDNYEKALDIRWLCRQHHREYHYNNPI